MITFPKTLSLSRKFAATMLFSPVTRAAALFAVLVFATVVTPVRADKTPEFQKTFAPPAQWKGVAAGKRTEIRSPKAVRRFGALTGFGLTTQ